MGWRTSSDEGLAIPGTSGDAGESALRTALAFSIVTGTPFTMHWGEDGVPAAAHAQALAMVSALGGEFIQTQPGTSEISYRPAPIRNVNAKIDAGLLPVGPLIQALALPLAVSGSASTLRITGVTHLAGSPSFHELALAWLPAVERLGFAGEVSLEAAGFVPDGGGVVSVRIFPSPRLHPIDLGQRGLLHEVQALALVANLGIGIAVQLERRLSERLRARGIAAQIEVLPMPVERGRGLAAVVSAQFERSRVVWAAVGEAGRPAAAVADEAVDHLQRLLERRGAVDGALAAQLLPFMAIASSSFSAPGAIGQGSRGASRVTTSEVTTPLLAVADVARRFLDVDIQVQGLPGDEGLVEVRPRATA